MTSCYHMGLHGSGAFSLGHCTLCRSQRLGSDVLRRAKERRIEWPEPARSEGVETLQDPHVYTTIDDAFSTVLQYLSSTTRQCKRYYQSCSEGRKNCEDNVHMRRFHTKKYETVQRRNPLQAAEDVHLVVHPGTYAVSSGAWGSSHQQTHVVRVDPGQSVNLNFVL